MRERRGARTLALAPVLLLVLSGCSLFGGDKQSGDDGPQKVTDAQVGWCFLAPTEQKPLVTELEKVDCAEPHGQEAYDLPTYAPKAGAAADVYPGEEALTTFADGACAKAFGEYVGISYLDSDYYFTYLLPSPRSWDQDDREALCLITTTGKALVGSVKGTAK